jgi:hypothetical protein
MWQLLVLVLKFLLAVLVAAGVAGCATLNPKPPVEAFAEKLADGAIIPAVRKTLESGLSSSFLTAGVQGINPTYVVKFSGKWVTGLEGEASVGVEGIAGQLMMSTAGKPTTSPVLPAHWITPAEAVSPAGYFRCRSAADGCPLP